MCREKYRWREILGLCMLLLVLVVVWDKGKKNPGEEYQYQENQETYENMDTEPKESNVKKEDLEETDILEQSGQEDENVGFLRDLSGLEPGTILQKEQIDFEHPEAYFMVWEIEEGDNLHERINGKSYRENPNIDLESLRYLKLPHYNFEGQIQVGELIVNRDITEDVIEAFLALFEDEYQIESMYLIDNYWTGDPDSTDWASIDANNTSAFCYRAVTGGSRLSNHAYGRAIDINPRQNPYVSYSSGKPVWAHENADPFIRRETGMPHVITHEDTAFRVFKDFGFNWGGDWKNPKDYQHFEKKQEG